MTLTFGYDMSLEVTDFILILLTVNDCPLYSLIVTEFFILSLISRKCHWLLPTVTDSHCISLDVTYCNGMLQNLTDFQWHFFYFVPVNEKNSFKKICSWYFFTLMKLVCEEIFNQRQVFHMPQVFAKKISTKEKTYLREIISSQNNFIKIIVLENGMCLFFSQFYFCDQL